VSAIALVEQLWDSARFWRCVATGLATAALALLVAALVSREPPDFSERPVIAVLRDAGRHPAWAVRLARTAHQIAVDSLDPPPPPAGRSYQLWIVGRRTAAPQPLGLLPLTSRKIIAETPTSIRLLTGEGELRVTLEPANGSLAEAPSGTALFRASLDGPDAPGMRPPLH
jgi:anti-sigma-K factor RskA